MNSVLVYFQGSNQNFDWVIVSGTSVDVHFIMTKHLSGVFLYFCACFHSDKENHA
jgi:hypothetical protein